MASPLLVTDTAALTEVVATLRDVSRVALDTEGNGMHAYRTRLCMVQLCAASPEASAEQVFIIDPLAGLDLAPLAELLGPTGPQVIIHDLAFDARLLSTVGLPLARVIDTALHARFLGLRETGLGALLGGRHSVTVSKAMQQDDWARRPITSAQLEYLADDVAHLGPLAAGLEADCAALGISEEIAIETEYALANARGEEAPVPAYARIKGARELPPVARAILREMVLVREAAAERWDVPVGRVVSNQSLMNTARARPTTIPELRRVAGLFDRGVAIAGDLLAAIVRGARAEDVPESERVHFQREVRASGELAVRRQRESALTVWRQKESSARSVDLQVVLPGHALSDIARRRPRSLAEIEALPGVGAARVARYGETILAALHEAETAPKPKKPVERGESVAAIAPDAANDTIPANDTTPVLDGDER